MWWLVNILEKTRLVICNWQERISSIVSSLRLSSKVIFSALEKLATHVNIFSFCPNAFQPKRTDQNLSGIGWLIPLMILDETWAHILSTQEMSYTHTEEKCGLDFSLWVAKPRIGKNKFATSGLADVVKTNSPQAAQPRVEEFVFTTTAKPWVEKFNRPHFSSVWA